MTVEQFQKIEYKLTCFDDFKEWEEQLAKLNVINTEEINYKVSKINYLNSKGEKRYLLVDGSSSYLTEWLDVYILKQNIKSNDVISFICMCGEFEEYTSKLGINTEEAYKKMSRRDD